MLFSYSAVTLAFFTIIAGSGMIASDEEAGRLDLIQAHPVSRDALFWGRFLAIVVAAIAILALTWGGCAVGQIGSTIPVSIAAMALPNVVSFAVLMLFGALALLMSMLLPSRTLAASVAALVLVISYAITSLARVISGLRGVARFSPLKYYQSGAAVNGLRWDWFLGLLAVAALCSLAAWVLYRRRDLRVSGEGNWRRS
jgi:ABC-2 type transport system permease protein